MSMPSIDQITYRLVGCLEIIRDHLINTFIGGVTIHQHNGYLALLLRTYLEDRTLQLELGGYKDYVQQVKYRLIPYVW